MNDQELMQSIKTKWGAAIAGACHASSVPESFLAALIANESGGNPDAKRFEKNVLAALWEVLLGRKANYGSIGRADILAAIHLSIFATRQIAFDDAGLPSNPFVTLDSLATSWGLVQIMGYEVIPFHLIAGVSALQQPATELPVAIRMLTEFATTFHFDLGKDFGEMFDCWNTGRPHAPTFDPQYIPNGLHRKAIYEALP
jgi:Transglycosylase SLT domain